MKSNLGEIFVESVQVALAYNSTRMEVEHYLLCLLKKFPESLITKYLETVMSREQWKKMWQNRLNESAEKTQDTKKIRLSPVPDYLHRVFKAIPLEMQLLKIDEMDETCFFLALLRYQDIDSLTYRNAIEFFKKNR
jgi:ATP-dependent Clp protease ATP-binding subunit ClpA